MEHAPQEFVRRESYSVSRYDPGDRMAATLHFACDFVPQDDTVLDAPPKDASHDQIVMVAEAAGRHPDQDISRAQLWDRDLLDRQSWRISGFFQDQGFHGATPGVSHRQCPPGRASTIIGEPYSRLVRFKEEPCRVAIGCSSQSRAPTPTPTCFGTRWPSGTGSATTKPETSCETRYRKGTACSSTTAAPTPWR